MPPRPYHHGNLRQALVDASFAVLGEDGLSGFSVARVARAVGVSTASPYRHFADRDHRLAAVAAQAAHELADRVRADADAAGSDPVERLAVTAGTYVRYVAERGAGFDVIFAPSLTELGDAELSSAGRELMDLLLGLAEPVAGDPFLVLERHIVTAHGYVALQRDGFFARRNPTTDSVAERAIRAARAQLHASTAGG
jgi:AcrR family transcriptional regulator